MLTFADLSNEILKIREAIDSVDVRGHQNRLLVNYAFERCNMLIDQINQTVREIQNEANEVGEDDGEPDSGSAG